MGWAYPLGETLRKDLRGAQTGYIPMYDRKRELAPWRTDQLAVMGRREGEQRLGRILLQRRNEGRQRSQGQVAGNLGDATESATARTGAAGTRRTAIPFRLRRLRPLGGQAVLIGAAVLARGKR